jgi:hypothetical protein
MLWWVGQATVLCVAHTGSQRVAGISPVPPSAVAAATGVEVLVVGTDDWAVEQSAAALSVAGHGVSRCHQPDSPVFPCNAVLPGRGCPLDAGVRVVVTARARPVAALTPGEMGVVCGLHAGLPLVINGISRGAAFTPWASSVVADRGDLAEAVTDVAGVRHRVVDVTEDAR